MKTKIELIKETRQHEIWYRILINGAVYDFFIDEEDRANSKYEQTRHLLKNNLLKIETLKSEEI